MAVTVTAFALVPLALIARARATTSPHPRLHVVPDMDGHPKFKAQDKATMAAKEKDAGSIELDVLDIDLLRSLNANARKSFRDIAKELHVSLTTVSNRVKNMERAGVIGGYIPVVDPAKLGFDIMVVIGIKVIHGL